VKPHIISFLLAVAFAVFITLFLIPRIRTVNKERTDEGINETWGVLALLPERYVTTEQTERAYKDMAVGESGFLSKSYVCVRADRTMWIMEAITVLYASPSPASCIQVTKTNSGATITVTDSCEKDMARWAVPSNPVDPDCKYDDVPVVEFRDDRK
jgi:hypothetical protein